MSRNEQPGHTQTPGGNTPARAGWPERLAALAVALITLAYGCTVGFVLWAKWASFDPYLMDFARGTRVYEMLLQRIPFDYSMHYYLFFYMGVYPLFLPIYAVFRSVLVVFAIHLFSFTLAIPLLYRIARVFLPGVLLPLAVVIGYVLNPSLQITAVSFLRMEAAWIVLFLLTVYLESRRAYRPAFYTAMTACVIRIDAAPAIFLLGFLYFLRRRRRLGTKIMKGSVLIMATMVGFMLIFRLVSGIPPDTDQLHLTELHAGSDGSLQVLLEGTIHTLLNPSSYRYLVVFLQTLLLPLLAPLHLLPVLPSLGYIVLSAESFLAIPLVSSLLKPDTFLVPYLHIHDTYVFPILFVAMIHGLRRLHDWGQEATHGRVLLNRLFRAALPVMLVLSFLVVYALAARSARGPTLLLPTLITMDQRPGPHARLAWEILSEIPREHSGLMQMSFAERAPSHGRLTEVYPCSQVKDETQYALFDLRAFSPNLSGEELLEIVLDIAGREDFRVERFEDGILLLRRGRADPKNGALIAWIETNRHCLLEALNRPPSLRVAPHSPLLSETCPDSIYREMETR